MTDVCEQGSQLLALKPENYFRPAEYIRISSKTLYCLGELGI